MDYELLEQVLNDFQKEAELFKKKHFGDSIITEELKEQFSDISNTFWNLTTKFKIKEAEILQNHKSK